MKAKVLVLTLLGACAMTFGATAQEVATSQNLPARKTVFNKDKASDHWFIDIEGGAVMLPFGEYNNKAQFMDRVALGMPMLGIGKWHNPWFATRLQMYGWRAYGYEQANINGGENLAKFGNWFAGANYQFMFDLVNYFGHYNPKTIFHVIPYVGLGAAYNIQASEKETFEPLTKDDLRGRYTAEFLDNFGGALNAGILFKFRLGRRVDLNLDAQMIATKINLRGTNAYQHSGADMMALLTAGLGFNLGTPEWTEVVPMDWALVNDLNSQINALRAENAELSKRPVSCPECPEVQEKVTEKVTNVYYSNVFFRLDSYKIDNDQKMNVESTAKYAIESGEKVYITGYADVQTGTSEYNMALSERRVKAVAAMLESLGVPSDQIVVDFKGSDVQPFEINEMNRVVIATGQPSK